MDDRERKLRNARRLRRGVVASGVVGSLGVAGLVGLPALQQVSASATSQAGSAPATSQAPGRYDGPRPAANRGGDGGEHEHGDDGGWSFDDGSGPSSRVPQPQWSPPSTGFAPPAPSGGGAPHAGSMGS